MKKPVTEERDFCDICEKPRHGQCLVCGQDLCDEHTVELRVRLCGDHYPGFLANLCPTDGAPLLPILEKLKGKSAAREGSDWLATGHNPQFNEAKLEAIVKFLKQAGE